MTPKHEEPCKSVVLLEEKYKHHEELLNVILGVAKGSAELTKKLDNTVHGGKDVTGLQSELKYVSTILKEMKKEGHEKRIITLETKLITQAWLIGLIVAGVLAFKFM